MQTSLVACCAASLLIVACGGASVSTAIPGAPAAKAPGAVAEATAAKPAPQTAGSAPPAAPAMQVGDYFVQRFSGSFSKQAMLLTERVIAREPGAFVIDFRLEQGKQASSLRLRVDAKDPRRILRVSEVKGDQESPSSLAVYEALMARTMFSPDENEEQLATERTTCLIGEREVDCERTSYRVRVGEKEATLTVVTSQAAHGRDLGGELMTADGKLLYRAQMIETGTERGGSGVAARD